MRAVERQMVGCRGAALLEGNPQGGGELGVLGGQRGEIEDWLHPLEGEFDLQPPVIPGHGALLLKEQDIAPLRFCHRHES